MNQLINFLLDFFVMFIERLEQAGIIKIVIGIIMAIILLIILIRILFTLLLVYLTFYYHKYKSYLFTSNRKNNEDYSKYKPKPTANRDMLGKDKKAEDLAVAEVQRMGDMADENAKELVAREQRIVDIVKPVGVWTARILGDRMSYLVSMAKSSQQEGGFWVNLVKANGMLYQGRGNERFRS